MVTLSELEAKVTSDKFREWQASMIFQPKLYGANSASAEEERQRAQSNQERLESAISRGADDVRAFICEELEIVNSTAILSRLPGLPKPLTEAEMKGPTLKVDQEVSQALDTWGISPRLAAESSFWMLCHARWIGDDRFPDGVAKVFTESSKAADDLEAQTRNFLRRTAGLHGIRGNTSVMTDCILSGCWWRTRIANEITKTASREGASLSFEVVHHALQPRTVWEEFVLHSIKRLAVLNAPKARAAVVCAYVEHTNSKGTHSKVALASAMQAVAQLGHHYVLDLTDWSRLVDTASEALAQPRGD